MTGRNVKLDKLLVASLRDLRQANLPLYLFVLEVIVQLHMLGTCTVFTVIFRIKVLCIDLQVYIGHKIAR